MIKKPKNWWLCGGSKGHKTIVLDGFLAARVAYADLQCFPVWGVRRSGDTRAAGHEDMILLSLWKSRWDAA